MNTKNAIDSAPLGATTIFSKAVCLENYENKLTEDLNKIRRNINIKEVNTFNGDHLLFAYLVRSIELIHERLDKLEASSEP